jgi:hypothetical protein
LPALNLGVPLKLPLWANVDPDLLFGTPEPQATGAFLALFPSILERRRDANFH